MPAKRVPLEIRFRSKYKVMVSGCWMWTAAKDKDGYGFIQCDGQKVRSHRVAWEMSNGSIPAGMVVCHTCDNPGCVNPDHLFLGTIADNNADMRAKKRNPRAESHGRAKLTVDAVREIRRSVGRTAKEIASAYGVSKSLIGQIRQSIVWKEVA